MVANCIALLLFLHRTTSVSSAEGSLGGICTAGVLLGWLDVRLLVILADVNVYL